MCAQVTRGIGKREGKGNRRKLVRIRNNICPVQQPGGGDASSTNSFDYLIEI